MYSEAALVSDVIGRWVEYASVRPSREDISMHAKEAHADDIQGGHKKVNSYRIINESYKILLKRASDIWFFFV